MAHAQKPDFIFRRKEWVHLNRRGRQFSRLLAAQVCASAVVMLDTPCSEVVWRLPATHSIRQFPVHFPSRASQRAITFQMEPISRLWMLAWRRSNNTKICCHNVYLLTPWCRVFREKLTSLQLVKKFPAFHGTRRFITALTSVRHLSLSWASPIQSIYPHPTCWRSIILLSTHLRLGLPSGLLPSGFPTKTLYTPLSSTIRATCHVATIFIHCCVLTVTWKHSALLLNSNTTGCFRYKKNI